MKSEKCRRFKIKNQQNLLSVSEKNVIRDCSYQKSLVKRRNQPEHKLSVTFFSTWTQKTKESISCYKNGMKWEPKKKLFRLFLVMFIFIFFGNVKGVFIN